MPCRILLCVISYFPPILLYFLVFGSENTRAKNIWLYYSFKEDSDGCDASRVDEDEPGLSPKATARRFDFLYQF
jgi:hypothetical protein